MYVRNPSGDTSTATGPASWLTATGSLRPNSDFTTAATSVLNGTVDAVVVQDDGKILLAGSFINTAGTTGGDLVRLNADGTLDASFNLALNGTVSAVAIDGSGRILIGGTFTSVGGLDRKHFARLNADGSVDASLDLRPNQAVREIAISGNGFYIAGEFTTVQFGTDAAVSRPYVALIKADNTLDTAFAPSVDGAVFSMLLQSAANRLLIGGNFTTVGGATHSSVARIDSSTGAVDAAFTLEFSSLIEDFYVQGSQILCAGDFTAARETSTGDSVARSYVARFTIDGSGVATLDPTFKVNTNAPVHTIRVDSQNRILIGGEFSAITDFSGASFIIRRFCARFNADGSLDDVFNPQPNGSIWAISVRPDDSVILGGSYDAILPEASILVGGAFTHVGNADLPYLARLNADGSADPRFAPHPDGAVYAAAGLADGRLIVGGDFQHMGADARARVAVFASDGALDSSFTTGTDGPVRAFAVQNDGRIIIGGTFANVGGAAHQNLARVAADGTIDGTFTPSTDGGVTTTVVQPDGRIIVAGTFATVDGTARPYLGRLDADGTLDSSFAPAVNGPVSAVALESDGGMLIGGQFTVVGGTPRLRYARLTSNGALDTSVRFDVDPDVTAVGSTSEVRTISPQVDGRAFVGGVFRSVGGRARYLITRSAAAVRATQSLTVNAARTLITWTNGGSRPEFGIVSFASSTDGATFTDLGVAQRTGTSGVWQLTVPALPANQLYYIRARATLPSTRNYSTGRYEAIWQFYNDRVAGPRTTGGLDAGTSGIGGGGNTAGDVGGDTGNGGDAGSGGGSGSTGGTAGSGGAGGSGGSAGLTSGAYHLVNFSVRAEPGNGDKLIAGFVLSAGSDRRVVLRAIGPGLETFHVNGVMPAPLLELFDDHQQPIASAAAWSGSSSLAQAFADVKAFALDPASADAAQAPLLAPGTYTTHVSPANGVNGIALSEVYFDGDSGGLANLSARGPAGDGDAVLIVGFVVGGDQPRRFLIRGVGPGLVAYHVDNALVDPVTSVFDVDGHAVATNDDWEVQTTGSAADITAAETSSGAFALATGSKDASLVLTLAPGVYTAHVTPSAHTPLGGATPGTGLVEVYELPSAE